MNQQKQNIILVHFSREWYSGKIKGRGEEGGLIVFPDRNANHLVTYTKEGYYLAEVTMHNIDPSGFGGYRLCRVIGGPDEAEAFRKHREGIREEQRLFLKDIEAECKSYLLELGMSEFSFDMVMDKAANMSLPLHFQLTRDSVVRGVGTVRVWVEGIPFLSHAHHFQVNNVPVHIQATAITS